jgi:hypothetical protein
MKKARQGFYPCRAFFMRYTRSYHLIRAGDQKPRKIPPSYAGGVFYLCIGAQGTFVHVALE